MVSFILAVALSADCFATPAATTDLDELRMERLELLRQLLKMSEEQYEVGTIRINAVMVAQQELLSAELEAADSREARIRILSDQVAVAKKLEEISNAQFEQGLAPQIDFLQAKSIRLKFAIKLEKARAEMGVDE